MKKNCRSSRTADCTQCKRIRDIIVRKGRAKATEIATAIVKEVEKFAPKKDVESRGERKEAVASTRNSIRIHLKNMEKFGRVIKDESRYYTLPDFTLRAKEHIAQFPQYLSDRIDEGKVTPESTVDDLLKIVETYLADDWHIDEVQQEVLGELIRSTHFSYRVGENPTYRLEPTTEIIDRTIHEFRHCPGCLKRLRPGELAKVKVDIGFESMLLTYCSQEEREKKRDQMFLIDPIPSDAEVNFIPRCMELDAWEKMEDRRLFRTRFYSRNIQDIPEETFVDLVRRLPDMDGVSTMEEAMERLLPYNLEVKEKLYVHLRGHYHPGCFPGYEKEIFSVPTCIDLDGMIQEVRTAVPHAESLLQRHLLQLGELTCVICDLPLNLAFFGRYYEAGELLSIDPRYSHPSAFVRPKYANQQLSFRNASVGDRLWSNLVLSKIMIGTLTPEEYYRAMTKYFPFYLREFEGFVFARVSDDRRLVHTFCGNL